MAASASSYVVKPQTTYRERCPTELGVGLEACGGEIGGHCTVVLLKRHNVWVRCFVTNGTLTLLVFLLQRQI